MRKSAVRFFSLALMTVLLSVPPLISAQAGGDPPSSSSPPPPATSKKGKKTSSIEDPRSLAGYRAAYAAIYERGEYSSAIDQLKALQRDDVAAVANLIGYSYRKLGDYKVSQIWYERALKSDPDHVKTWQYYGLWQVEQGNRDQAQYHLSRIAALAGTGSDEYRSLAAALEKAPGTGLVY
jgi:tetratricopeptide (TPR) repeat protein